MRLKRVLFGTLRIPVFLCALVLFAATVSAAGVAILVRRTLASLFARYTERYGPGPGGRGL